MILAIRQLPAAAAILLQGKVYFVEHDGHVPMLGVLWKTLLEAGEHASWVTENDIGSELSANTPLAKRMLEAVDSGRIRAYRKVGTGKPFKVLEELDYFGVKKGALVVMEGTFSGGLATFREYSAAKGCTLLLVSRPDEAGEWIEGLSGFARCHLAEGRPRWDVLYWFGASGVVAGASFGLSLLEDGSLGLDSGEAKPRQEEGSPADEDRVFVSRGALSGKKPPEGWRVVENFSEAQTLLADARGATILLHFDQNTVLGELTRLVFNLRQSCGKHVKILVRQINARLRHSQEQLLLRLGANFVIPAEVLFSHLGGIVEMVRGQVYPHELEQDYDEAIGRVMPSPVHGYLMPQDFVASVKETMARSSALVIRNALVRLKLVPGLSPLDALRSCWMKRKGDFCTADEEHVYLFLFACRESNVEATLDRQFSYPVSVLFEGEEIFLAEEDILKAAANLAETTKGGTYPSIALVNPMEGYADEGDRGWLPATFPHVPPSVATRRTLALRRKGGA